MTLKRAEIDMSPEAIAGRLKEIGELWDLWNRLRRAEYMGPAESTGDDQVLDSDIQKNPRR